MTASSQQSPLHKWLVILFVLAIAAFSTVPNYVTDRWTWKNPPELPNVQALRTLQQQGLPMSDWHILERQVIEIGGHKWSYQSMSSATPTSTSATSSPPTSPAIEPLPRNLVLLLRPQTWRRDLPQVDWMDINGTQGWTEDSQRQLQFSVPTADAAPKTIQVNARFFRGWNQERTYAVLQWYAWAEGGSSTPSHWFWADQWSQWRDRQRTPWIAVSLFFPIKPLGDIETVRAQAEAVGQQVQATLMQTSLS